MPRATTAACEVLPPRLVRMPLCLEEAVDVLGLGFLAHQDDLFAAAAARFSGVGVEDNVAGGGAGRGRQALGQRVALEVGRELRHQQLLQHRRVDTQQRLFLGDQALVAHFDRAAHHAARVHLAVARLQAVEDALLDGEFEILHFAIVRFKAVVQLDQLVVDIGHFLRHLGDGLGRADAGDDVLALGIDEVFAVNHVLAGAGVAGEADAGARVVAHVAEDHGDDVDRRAAGLVGRDPELLAVVDGALAVPGTEHGLDGDVELFEGVLREGLAGVAGGRWRGRLRPVP